MADVTLDTLVDRLRKLVADPAGDRQVFDRDEIEEVLATFRWDAVQYPLDYSVENLGGALGGRFFSAGVGSWADDAALTDINGNNVVIGVNDLVDLQSGTWSFFNIQAGVPYYVTGRSYDLYGAAAELLRRQAAKMKLQYDLSVGDLSVSRSQKQRNLLEMADTYDRRRRAVSVRVDAVL
jgi:hypothetical protein